MKLHVGCGSVYLAEWVNVDLPLPHVFLARERTDLVKKFVTVESEYYARHSNKNQDTWREGAIRQESVADVYGAFHFLPVRPQTVSEILSRQVFEHLSMSEGRQALLECKRVLCPDGILRLDIPDPDETLKRYQETGDLFFRRHLFGPRLDEYGFHTHYTRKMLITCAEAAGFSFVAEERNVHDYPAFCLRFSLKPKHA